MNTYLRSNRNLFGTKFMCLEGGCGVCVVTLRRIHPVTKKKYTIAVNSCLYPILLCDGSDIETIEFLRQQQKGYHPIQKRLAEYNGSQCGYCSPAMVMGIYSLLESAEGRVTMEEVENALGGHICRCTGYRPILDAFKSMATDANQAVRCNPSTGDIEDVPMCKKTGSQCSQTCTTDQMMKKCFVPLADTQRRFGFEWHKTVALADIFDVFATLDDATQRYMLVGGNTAHGVYRRPDDIQVFIDVNNVAELRAHAMTADNLQLEVGAGCTLTEFMLILAECAKSHDKQFAYCMELAKHVDLIATNAVRNVSGVHIVDSVGTIPNGTDGISVLYVNPLHIPFIRVYITILFTISPPSLCIVFFADRNYCRQLVHQESASRVSL